MIKIAFIEDEAIVRQKICQNIENIIAPFTDVMLESYKTAEEFLDVKTDYDIVISDILRCFCSRKLCN